MTDPIVKIESGFIKGKLCENYRGIPFYGFLNIPYAKPPIGKLRFKAPVAADPWEGVKDCTTEGPECWQKDLLRPDIVCSEDCLSLNAYTQKLPKEQKCLKPVMVWIHGGGFISGTSHLFNPDYFLAEDVVFVSINYRLGIFGFLSLEDPSLDVPGNAGMKDMILCLKWVQKNISEFNGDRNNVTIFGQSAGGASVHYLMLSPLSKGLFHKAVAMSGSALNPWAVGYPNAARLAAVNMGFTGKSDKEILEFLTSISAEDVLKAQLSIVDVVIHSHKRRPFAPIVETPAPGAFLCEQPIDIMNSGNYMKVPFLTGFNDEEGVGFIVWTEKAKNSVDLDVFIPHSMGIPKSSARSKEIVKEIEKFYLTQGAEGLHHLCSDVSFIHGIHTTVRKHLETSPAPVYSYRFSLDTKLNHIKRIIEISKQGAVHGDELCYLFRALISAPDFELGSPEETHVVNLVKLWTNFAKNGNPNPVQGGIEWKAASKEALYYLEIGHELSLETVLPETERLAFWDKLFADVYKL